MDGATRPQHSMLMQALESTSGHVSLAEHMTGATSCHVSCAQTQCIQKALIRDEAWLLSFAKDQQHMAQTAHALLASARAAHSFHERNPSGPGPSVTNSYVTRDALAQLARAAIAGNGAAIAAIVGAAECHQKHARWLIVRTAARLREANAAREAAHKGVGADPARPSEQAASGQSSDSAVDKVWSPSDSRWLQWLFMPLLCRPISDMDTFDPALRSAVLWTAFALSDDTPAQETDGGPRDPPSPLKSDGDNDAAQSSAKAASVIKGLLAGKVDDAQIKHVTDALFIESIPDICTHEFLDLASKACATLSRSDVWLPALDVAFMAGRHTCALLMRVACAIARESHSQGHAFVFLGNTVIRRSREESQDMIACCLVEAALLGHLHADDMDGHQGANDRAYGGIPYDCRDRVSDTRAFFDVLHSLLGDVAYVGPTWRTPSLDYLLMNALERNGDDPMVPAIRIDPVKWRTQPSMKTSGRLHGILRRRVVSFASSDTDKRAPDPVQLCTTQGCARLLGHLTSVYPVRDTQYHMIANQDLGVWRSIVSSAIPRGLAVPAHHPMACVARAFFDAIRVIEASAPPLPLNAPNVGNVERHPHGNILAQLWDHEIDIMEHVIQYIDPWDVWSLVRTSHSMHQCVAALIMHVSGHPERLAHLHCMGHIARSGPQPRADRAEMKTKERRDDRTFERETALMALVCERMPRLEMMANDVHDTLESLVALHNTSPPPQETGDPQHCRQREEQLEINSARVGDLYRDGNMSRLLSDTLVTAAALDCLPVMRRCVAVAITMQRATFWCRTGHAFPKETFRPRASPTLGSPHDTSRVQRLDDLMAGEWTITPFDLAMQRPNVMLQLAHATPVEVQARAPLSTWIVHVCQEVTEGIPHREAVEGRRNYVAAWLPAGAMAHAAGRLRCTQLLAAAIRQAYDCLAMAVPLDIHYWIGTKRYNYEGARAADTMYMSLWYDMVGFLIVSVCNGLIEGAHATDHRSAHWYRYDAERAESLLDALDEWLLQNTARQMKLSLARSTGRNINETTFTRLSRDCRDAALIVLAPNRPVPAAAARRRTAEALLIMASAPQSEPST